MTTERVIVTRTEIQQLGDKANEILALTTAILRRPEPEPIEEDARGWPLLNPERQDD